MHRIRLILAYRGTLCRAGIRSLLGAMPAIDVVGEARDGREAVALARKLRPDVALLLDSLPAMNGVEAASRISAMNGIRVGIVSGFADARAVATALRAGAKGYLLEDDPPAELSRMIRAIARGEVHVSSGASKRLLRSRASGERLTPRQREILQMIVEGSSTKQVAQVLRISVKTVETHRALLMDRLGIYDVPGLVRYALKNRLSHL